MSEKISSLEQPNVLQTLLKRVHPDRIPLSSHETQEEIEMINNTATAFSMFRQYFNQYGKAPDTWQFLGFNKDLQSTSAFSSQSQFMFTKVEDGTITHKEIHQFTSPVAFFVELRKFHGLDDLLTPEEKTAEELERRSAEARALRLYREAKNNINAPIVETKPATSTSPFRFRK